MGFMKPKVPKPAPAPNPASQPLTARDSTDEVPNGYGPASFITTSPGGLRRKAELQRSSLIGGA